MAEFRDLAIEKIDKELKDIKNGDREVNVIKERTAEAIKYFCCQEEEFAQAVVQSDKTFFDCCKAAVVDVRKDPSDLAVFRKAVKFYFSTADIRVDMTIDLCGNIGSADKPKGKIINLSIDDLF